MKQGKRGSLRTKGLALVGGVVGESTINKFCVNEGKTLKENLKLELGLMTGNGGLVSGQISKIENRKFFNN
jgi:hypothetical protein